MLLLIKCFFTMSQGWPRKSVECALGNEHPINPEPAFSFLLNHLGPAAVCAYGLSKCHWYRGRFANYVPPVLELLGLVELEHNARNNRVRAIRK
jgi:hypothetical protein